MARELTESRKALVDMLLEQLKKDDLINREERINKQVIELKKELSDIVDRAYQSQVSKVIGDFQEKLSDNTLSEEERTSIEQERKEFEDNPAIKGVVREKTPIENEEDKARVLQIVELLKDTEQLGDIKDPLEMNGDEFSKYMEDFAERNKPNTPEWLRK